MGEGVGVFIYFGVCACIYIQNKKKTYPHTHKPHTPQRKHTQAAQHDKKKDDGTSTTTTADAATAAATAPSDDKPADSQQQQQPPSKPPAPPAVEQRWVGWDGVEAGFLFLYVSIYAYSDPVSSTKNNQSSNQPPPSLSPTYITFHRAHKLDPTLFPASMPMHKAVRPSVLSIEHPSRDYTGA